MFCYCARQNFIAKTRMGGKECSVVRNQFQIWLHEHTYYATGLKFFPLLPCKIGGAQGRDQGLPNAYICLEVLGRDLLSDLRCWKMNKKLLDLLYIFHRRDILEYYLHCRMYPAKKTYPYLPAFHFSFTLKSTFDVGKYPKLDYSLEGWWRKFLSFI